MKTADIQKMAQHMARACGIQYTVKVTLKQSAHPEDEATGAETYAEVHCYGTTAHLKIYPAFAGLSFEDRRETIAHELAHVRLHEYTGLATSLAGAKAEALVQPEERLCDALSSLILSACYEAGVDFGPIA